MMFSRRTTAVISTLLIHLVPVCLPLQCDVSLRLRRPTTAFSLCWSTRPRRSPVRLTVAQTG